MLDELNAKMSSINNEIESEQEKQNKLLQEALSRRKAKKDLLRNKIGQITDKKELEDEHYQNKMVEIQTAYEADKKSIEDDVKKEERNERDEVVDAMREKREALLKPHEDKLNEYRKKQLNHDTEYEFS